MERIECCSEVETIDEWCIFEWVSVDNAPFVGCSECVCVCVCVCVWHTTNKTTQKPAPKTLCENMFLCMFLSFVGVYFLLH